MKSIKISKLEKKLLVRFSNKEVRLPKNWQVKIDDYWQSLLASGKTYTRGEVFTVTESKEQEKEYNILVEKTDYAHYLYCQNIDSEMDGHGVRIIFTACLVETSDGKIIFGKMGKQTARAGIHQLAGGGIESSDLKNGLFDFKNNISKELSEELRIDTENKKRVAYFKAAYLKQGGDTKKIAVIFHLKLNETSQEFTEKYNSFTKKLKDKNEEPEFGEIIMLEKSQVAIQKFFTKNREQCDEYMEPLFNFIYF